MEVDSHPRTFLPQSGAYARQMARELSVVERTRIPSKLSTAIGRQAMQQPWHHYNPEAFADTEPSAGMRMPRDGTALKSASVPSLLPFHRPSYGLPDRSGSESNLLEPSGNIKDLVKAARRKLHELPSSAEVRSLHRQTSSKEQFGPSSSAEVRKLGASAAEGRSLQRQTSSKELHPTTPARGLLHRQTSCVELPPATKQLAECLSRQSSWPVSSPTPAAARDRKKERSSLWSIQEESQRLSQELVRLGKPPDTHKWANEEVENSWLRREATYELFKALVGTGGTSPENEGSTRAPTPAQSSNCGVSSASEYDSLTNLLGKELLTSY